MPKTLAALATATLLSILAATPAPAQTQTQTCTPGSVAGNVSFGSLVTTVPNRCGADGVSVDDRIDDESPWGN